MPTVIKGGREEKALLLEDILKENQKILKEFVKTTRLNYIVILLQFVTIIIALLR